MIKFINIFVVTAFLCVSQVACAWAQLKVDIPDRGKSEWIELCGQPGKPGYDACELLADQNLKGLYGVPRSERYTVYYLLKACRYGNFGMCEFSVGMAKDEEANADIIVEASAILCQQGNPLYCQNAHQKLADENHPIYNARLAGEFAKTGCEMDHIPSCVQTAGWFDNYKPKRDAVPDPSLEVWSRDKVCSAMPGQGNTMDGPDIATSCFLLHRATSGDETLPADNVKSGEALMRACDLGQEKDTCEYAASSFYYGNNGVAKDADAAAKMMSQVCRMGEEYACDHAGYHFESQEDFESAFQIFTTSCDRDPSQYRCVGAVNASYFVQGPKHATTTKYAKKACDLDDGYSCHVYASNTMFLDADYNRHIYQKSCDLGYETGCTQVQELNALAERNVLIDERNRQMIEDQMRPPAPNMQPTRDDFMRQGREYWSNWKPSYCRHTRVNTGVAQSVVYNSRKECTDF